MCVCVYIYIYTYIHTIFMLGMHAVSAIMNLTEFYPVAYGYNLCSQVVDLQ